MSKKQSSKYSSILRNYRAAIKRADAAGYKLEVSKATIPVKIGDQHDTLRLVNAYRAFKRSVQRARNVKLANQRIQTNTIRKFKKSIAKRNAEREKTKKGEEPIKGGGPGPDTRKKKKRPGPGDYENIAFMNIQEVLEKALHVTKPAYSAKQEAYFTKVEEKAQEIQDFLKSVNFYDPEMMDIYRGNIEDLYKQIQKSIESFAWYDSEGLIDTSDNLDMIKSTIKTILQSKGQDSAKAQRIMNNVYGEEMSVAGVYA